MSTDRTDTHPTGDQPADTPPVLWTPTPERAAAARLTGFHRRAAATHGAPPPTGDPAADYTALHTWSVHDLENFWRAVTDEFHVDFSTPPDTVLADPAMPGASWFPGARTNYARHALRHADDPATAAHPALVHLDETLEPRETSWADLRDQVARLAAALRDLGIRPGDRVGAYLPNTPHAVVALLATAAVGAVWTSCPPDFGARGVLDRLQQTEPAVLFTVDGYRYAGRTHDRTATVAELRAALPTVHAHIHIPVLGSPPPAGALAWDDLTAARPGIPTPEPAYEEVPFDHPLWILYSSGTTGLPKALVHSHGGILVEHLKQLGLHLDLGPDDRLYWYTSTGWMMWNFLVGALLVGATPILHDGSPAHPAPDATWRAAAAARAAVLGTSAAYVMASRKNDLHPGRDLDLSAVRCVATTGSPLPPDGFAWIHDALGPDLWPASVSGGTDVCTCFVGGVPTLPVHLGEIQAACLGTDAQAWNDKGDPVTDEVGELVVTAPMPSMPVRFWNDPDGTRYRDSYFATYPGVWRHGDWVTTTPRGSFVIHGRSDSTLNRQGVRMGSADIYEVVERLPEITESLVLGIEEPDGGYWMPLFVVLAPGAVLDDALRTRIRTALRTELSPRHVPDDILAAPAVPKTLTGKRIEVPVKKLLQGSPPDTAANRSSLANPEALDWFGTLPPHHPPAP